MTADWRGTLNVWRKSAMLVSNWSIPTKSPLAKSKPELTADNLLVSGAHVGIDFLRGNLDQVISDLKLLGARYVICPWIAPPNGVVPRIGAPSCVNSK
jgi:hypothetical protein